jgi:hypothetical protein
MTITSGMMTLGQGQATSDVRKEVAVSRTEHLSGLAQADRDVRRNGTRWIDPRTSYVLRSDRMKRRSLLYCTGVLSGV